MTNSDDGRNEKPGDKRSPGRLDPSLDVPGG